MSAFSSLRALNIILHQASLFAHFSVREFDLLVFERVIARSKLNPEWRAFKS
jgi:hypothetical protein